MMVYVRFSEAVKSTLIHNGIERLFSSTVYILISNIGTCTEKWKNNYRYGFVHNNDLNGSIHT